MRRRVAVWLTFAVLCAAGSGFGASPAAAEPVPMGQALSYQGNVAHSGYVSDPAVVPPFHRKWTTSLLGTGSPSYPVFAAGKVLVTGGLPRSEYGEALYALDEQTGAIDWWQALGPDGHWANAAADGSRVFAVDEDGTLQAFDAATGARLWSRRDGPSGAPPVAWDGIVYIGDGDNLDAISESDGSLLWRESTDPINEGRSAVAVDPNRVYVTYDCNWGFAFDRLTGTQSWLSTDNSCTGDSGATPALYQGRLYFDTGVGHILDAGSGADLGTYNAHPGYWGGVLPAFKDGIQVLARGYSTQYHQLQATELSTGSALWQASGDGELLTPPLIVDDTVYVGSWTGTLFAYDVASGNQVWSDNAGVGPFNPATQTDFTQPLSGLGAGDGLLVAPIDNSVVAYESDSAGSTAVQAGAPPSSGPPPSNSPASGASAAPSPSSTGGATVATTHRRKRHHPRKHRHRPARRRRHHHDRTLWQLVGSLVGGNI